MQIDLTPLGIENGTEGLFVMRAIIRIEVKMR